MRPETLRDAGLGGEAPAPRAEAMKKVFALAERAAAGTINVLVTGETGVGKELLAEMVHRASPRRDGPYVCLNCAALSETLLESELFGHERGAFTGAVAAKPGLLETAAGGTLFLDEVGELPLATQAKLLRVIETREVTRLGSVRPRRIDVRFIAATNRELEAEVGRGSFRQDLYFRFNGITLTIPPLRTRVVEIPHLAETFARQICRDLGRPPPVLPPPIMALLEAYAWPGNIRELKNVVERAVLLSTGPIIGPEHLPLEKLAPAAVRPAGPTPLPPGGPTPPPRVDTQKLPAPTEREKIIAALEACAGNQSRAAELLSMPRRTFVNKLDLYKIPRPKKKQDDDDN
jgi:DNA-binding NtrC family response regulator